MRIFIDIGHPAHVHYFRNFIKIMESKGHTFIVSARDRYPVFELLDFYNIKYYNRGKGNKSIVGKVFNMFKTDYSLLKIALKHKPDIFLSFSSHYAAQVAFILQKPHIAVNDTEHEDTVHSILTYPFTDSILTPSSFQNDLGQKQIRFNNVVEGLYLNPKLFTPNKNIKKTLGVQNSEEYVILRFVSWNAHHDVGHTGINDDLKREMIKILKLKYKIFISSEGDLEDEFQQYKIEISPEMMHDVLGSASIFIGESSTMASESAQLGTQSIFINSLPLMCNIKVGQDAGLIKWFKNSNGVVNYLKEVISDEELKNNSIKRSKKMQSTFINPTSLLIWFIENYPESKIILKDNPDYQLKFK